jgi:NADH-quinone oxidoreductase subunit H
MILFILVTFFKILTLILPLILTIAFFTLYERKVIGSIQRRVGPDQAGPFGLLQPFADAFKLLIKESILPTKANPFLFVLAPIITLVLSFLAWAALPLGKGLVLADLNIGILYLFAVSSLGVYGVILAGWASNSKYAFLGALRSAAQIVSYEVSIGLIIITVILCVGSLNLTHVVEAQKAIWFIFPLFPLFLIFFVSILAETNRHPFDLPEAEAELVAGYNVEYASIGFALFFLGEYGSIIIISSLTTILFLGGWLPPINLIPFSWIPGPVWFALKVAFIIFLFLWVRVALPRYRYDQLIRLGWKIFLPLSIAWVIIVASILVAFGWLPQDLIVA